ncbi:MAG: hypothetical protein SPE81_05510 [Agathobacter sp.]|nr:hypothetical protein [Agathobacter sp.]
MSKNNKTAFLVINIWGPIIIGTIIYYLISPDVLFVEWIDTFLGKVMHISCIDSSFWLVKFIRNYMLDMMWGYALVFALYFIIGNNSADLLKIFVIAFTLSAVMEILQLTPFVEGTFDVLDIIVEFLAEVVAVFIIKKYFLEEVQKRYEKRD